MAGCAIAVAAILVPGAAGAGSVAPGAAAVAQTLAVVAAPTTGTVPATTGTAFAIRSEPGRTLFLTAAHVVGCRPGDECAAGTAVTVYLAGDLRRRRSGYVVKVGRPDRNEDLALFVVAEGPLPVVTFGGRIGAGDAVAALGYPESTLEALRDRTLEATADAVLSLGTVQRSDGVSFAGTFATHSGDSGGPVFEPVSGRVLGVVHGRAPGGGPYLAVGANAITAFAASAMSGEIPTAGVAAAPEAPADSDPAALYGYAQRVHHSDPGAYARALRRAAEGGNGFAAEDLGNAYYKGDGVERDVTLSRVWHDRALVLLQKMSDAGDGAADYVLGRNAEIAPDATRRDGLASAMTYFRRGAERKNCDSIERIAALFQSGGFFPDPADPAQGAQWYHRGAAQGCQKSMYELGRIYETGNGVTKDLRVALHWYDEDFKHGGFGNIEAARLRRSMGLAP